MLDRLAGYGGRAAIASGILALVGTVFLLLFYAIEAPAIFESGDTETWVPLGRTNDALIGLSALAAVPLAALLHASWRQRAEGASTATFAVAAVALLVTGAMQLLYAANVVSSALQTLVIGPLFLGIAAWLLAVNVGRAHPSINGVLRGVGVAAGIGYLLLALTTVLYYTSGTSDPSALFANPLFAVVAGLGLAASQIGYPLWAIWLGRGLLRGETGDETLAPQAA
jgi:hypothetical protein